MVEFLELNLDDEDQSAYVRLHDNVLSIIQARFSREGMEITRFGTDGKSKQFRLPTREMQELATAWVEYEGRCMQHTVEIAEHKKATVAKAKELAKSVHFDLAGLNVHGIANDYGWKVVIPAVGFERQAHNADELLKEVQAAFDYLKQEVAFVEQNGYRPNKDWSDIVASYRRAFPLNPLASEPIQIIQARELLKEAGIEGWKITHGSLIDGTWNFDGPFASSGEISMPDETPEQLLADIKEYLERKKSDVILDQMDAQQGEPAEIAEARALLKEGLRSTDWAIVSIYPGTSADCWSFDNGLEGKEHYAMLNHPATHILDFVSQYITETKRGQGGDE